MAYDSYSQNSSKPEMPITPEELDFCKEKFSKAISLVEKKEDVLIYMSCDSNIDHLDSAKKKFKEIIIVKPTDSQTINSTELSGKSDQPEGKEAEHGDEEAIIRVVNMDLKKENLTDLPEATVTVFWIALELVSDDIEDLNENLKKCTNNLITDGHMIMSGALNGTFYKAGGEKFHVVKYNEGDLRNMLSNEGFVITDMEVSKRKVESDLTDSDSVVFCTARKGQKS